MSDEIIVIAPELKPGAGGVADYTLRVVEQWGERVPVRFILPEGAPASARDRIEIVPRNGRALRAKLPEGGGKVFLQYSAYGFDRTGYPRWLLRALVDWKQKSGGRLVIMFHEIWAFWPVLNKNYLVQQLHRRDLGKLNAVADAIFTSTASQAEHLRSLTPDATVEMLPVGSNIRVAAGAGERRQPGLAVLFGLQLSRIKALREMLADLQALAASGGITRIVTVGGGNRGAGSREERELLVSLALRDGFEQREALAEEKVSQLLQAAEFGISAQPELSLTKSGTFMAYAAHGLAVLSPHASLVRPEPLCWLVSPAELLRGLTVDEVEIRAKKLHAWQEQTAGWPVIASRFAEALDLT